MGVRRAQGDWIVFIDQDDYWEPNVIPAIFESIERATTVPDMVMVDHYFHKGNQVTPNRYAHNSSHEYSGLEFIKHEELTWAPWGYLYRKDFLLEHQLRFAEHVRFEDADFVIRCISYAQSIYYLPVSLVHYTVNVDSTTNIGEDTADKLAQMFMHDGRIYEEYLRITTLDPEAGKVIKGHALFAYRIGSYRFIWLKYRDICQLAHQYFQGKFTWEDGAYLGFVSKFPTLFAMLVSCAAPLSRLWVRYKKYKSLQ